MAAVTIVTVSNEMAPVLNAAEQAVYDKSHKDGEMKKEYTTAEMVDYQSAVSQLAFKTQLTSDTIKTLRDCLEKITSNIK